VSSGLNISSAASVSTSVSCSAGTMKRGQVLKAYPKGTRYSYKIFRLQGNTAGQVTYATSGLLYAFNPKANQIACSL
jgi:hypothetical protein